MPFYILTSYWTVADARILVHAILSDPSRIGHSACPSIVSFDLSILSIFLFICKDRWTGTRMKDPHRPSIDRYDMVIVLNQAPYRISWNWEKLFFMITLFDLNRIWTGQNIPVQYHIVPVRCGIFWAVWDFRSFFMVEPYRLLAGIVWYILSRMVSKTLVIIIYLVPEH